MEDKNFSLKNPIKEAVFARLIAKSIDIAIAVLISIILYPFGILLGVLYLCISDSLWQGRSVGKRIIGFRVISVEDGTPCSFKQSSIRNLPLTIPLFLAIVPFWGWILAIMVAFPTVLLEVYLLFTLDSGHRLGDVMADTTVIANDPKLEEILRKSKKKLTAFGPTNLLVF